MALVAADARTVVFRSGVSSDRHLTNFVVAQYRSDGNVFKSSWSSQNKGGTNRCNTANALAALVYGMANAMARRVDVGRVLEVEDATTARRKSHPPGLKTRFISTALVVRLRWCRIAVSKRPSTDADGNGSVWEKRVQAKLARRCDNERGD